MTRPMLFAATATSALARGDRRLETITAPSAHANVVSGPGIVACTLSGRTQTACFSITFRHTRRTTRRPLVPEPYRRQRRGWRRLFVEGGGRDVDAVFIIGLAEIYGDTNWQIFAPETGDVHYTGTLEACEASPHPDVNPVYRLHCVLCVPEPLPEDTSPIQVTPLGPAMVESPSLSLSPTGRGV